MGVQRTGGLGPLDFENIIKKGCFLSSEWEKTKFSNLGPLFWKNPLVFPPGKSPPDAHGKVHYVCVVIFFTCLQYNELVKKKKIVENDKAKIQKTIEELDQMKNEAVTKAYIQVCVNMVCECDKQFMISIISCSFSANAFTCWLKNLTRIRLSLKIFCCENYFCFFCVLFWLQSRDQWPNSFSFSILSP